MKINKQAKSLDEIGGHARQGDTLLRRIINVPAKLFKTKKCTLALGETSGHHHTFNDGGAVGFADDEKDLSNFVSVENKESALEHQEHETIVFPKGNYESLQQVEYTPEAIRRVAD